MNNQQELEQAYKHGKSAYCAWESAEDNPYEPDTEKWASWLQGYNDQEKEDFNDE